MCLGFRLGPWPQGTCSGLGALEPFGSLGLDGVCRLLLATLSFGSLGLGLGLGLGAHVFCNCREVNGARAGIENGMSLHGDSLGCEG